MTEKQLTIDSKECAHKGKRLNCNSMSPCSICADCGEHIPIIDHLLREMT